MIVQTVTHNVKITVDGMDSPIEVTDSAKALAALEGFKMGAPYITVPAEDDCVLYINTKYIISIQDCATTETETVTDAACSDVVTE